MNLRTFPALTIAFFCLFTAITAGDETPKLQAGPTSDFSAVGGSPNNITLGSLDPNTGFKFLIELTTRGAAISKATLSEFDDRNYKNPQPLVLLSPAVKPDGSQAFSMENQALVLTDRQLQLRLDKLDWYAMDVTKGRDGSETARFEATIKDKATDQPVIKLTKTYRVAVGIYHLSCDLTIENLSSGEQQMCLDLAGPVGINQEDPRADTRKAIAAFRDTQGQIVSATLDVKKLSKARTNEHRRLSQRGAGFLWAAITNKYFAAIVIPTPDANMNFCNWVADKLGWFSNPDGDSSQDSGDETIGIDLKTTSFTLAAADQPQSTKTLSFQLFLGPKDKSVFDKNPLYKNLGFVQTIDFMACCCPTAIIHPLAFGILGLMKWLHGFIPNYGIVIIIFVLLVRLILHPLTRKSQVSMSQYAKFNALPEVQEIRKQYGKDMMEMNRRIGEVQKKHGVSHSTALIGMLPMLIQMPIWIALYGAIYASIDLRGASFLPFWITDLSAPDALFKFKAIPIPFFGKLDSFNLLPILMGVAFYLQQKLTPTQTASPDPQTAQQQKIMMIMMTALFPLMLYKGPSGLNLYIIASVFGGVFEQYVIKKHIRDKEQAQEQGLVAVTSKTGGKVKKPKPKPFFKI
ncbi:MAG: YidC/Oxa1 family insertase periplasmic-domain containing protein [Sedimentisphaerales bacterium]|nr:YidC/Oxa1 family insertase periplasmic-domain containing protein [Sedimentisphaerales bacterium]